MYSLSRSKGVHVYINSKSDTLTSFDGFDVSVDTMTDIVVRRKLTERLPAPYSSCVSHITTFGSIFTKMFTEKNMSYRQSSCFEFCFQRKLTETCGCNRNSSKLTQL
jgi:hypothetical protein